ncbi:MAG: ABC transporter permease, partial [Clostridia bacterium]|nr:ABC transporter permease [Clostridia bacterium]
MEKNIAMDTPVLYDEQNTFRGVMRRLFRENKLAILSLIIIGLFVIGAVFAPWITPYGYEDIDPINRLSGLSREHPLGADELGRDVLTRLLYGSRISLLVGIVPTIISMLAGAVLGIVAGYMGGCVDSVIMRLADIMLAFPSMLLAMVIMYTLGDGIINIFLAL